MEFQVQLAKGKGMGLKDIDLNKVYIWINWPIKLGQILLWKIVPMELKIGDSNVTCYLWDSTTPIRWTNNEDILIQLVIDIDPLLIWAILSNDLFLILGWDA